MEQVIGVGVLLKTSTGTFLLQERDSGAPVHPGRIAAFGGGLEGAEGVYTCAQRELYEELHLSVAVNQLESIGLFESHHSPGRFIHMFLVKEVDAQLLLLLEGESIVELTFEAALTHPQVTSFTKNVLQYLYVTGTQ
jgi:8-oxo-dGTP pyrophosphatase MutT (NUDIX family)